MSLYPAVCPKCHHLMTHHVHRVNMEQIDCCALGCGCRVTGLELLRMYFDMPCEQRQELERVMAVRKAGARWST